jgi:hypothetical protein
VQGKKFTPEEKQRADASRGGRPAQIKNEKILPSEKVARLLGTCTSGRAGHLAEAATVWRSDAAKKERKLEQQRKARARAKAT